MIEYFVNKGTRGRLVNLETQQERPYVSTRDHAFTTNDLVFSPATMFAQQRVIVRDFGFRTGDQNQRQKYVWVVSGEFVEERGDDEEEV